jgi:hypothetical protein
MVLSPWTLDRRWLRVRQEDLGGFGDVRLHHAGADLLAAMGERPATCVHALAKDCNKALSFGRFLDHHAVNYAEMLITTGHFTAQRAARRHVLAVQDTTEFNFPGHAASKSGFGRSGNNRDLGLFLHPTVAVDADHDSPIGLAGAQVHNPHYGTTVEFLITLPHMCFEFEGFKVTHVDGIRECIGLA